MILAIRIFKKKKNVYIPRMIFLWFWAGGRWYEGYNIKILMHPWFEEYWFAYLCQRIWSVMSVGDTSEAARRTWSWWQRWWESRWSRGWKTQHQKPSIAWNNWTEYLRSAFHFQSYGSHQMTWISTRLFCTRDEMLAWWFQMILGLSSLKVVY